MGKNSQYKGANTAAGGKMKVPGKTKATVNDYGANETQAAGGLPGMQGTDLAVASASSGLKPDHAASDQCTNPANNKMF